MSDIKPVNQINFDYEGKHYCLEFTRESVKRMEAAGYKPGEAGETPIMELDMLWAGAFYKNHRNVSSKVMENLLDMIDNQDELLDKLRAMIAETYNSLRSSGEDSEKNLKWTATF